MKQAQLIQPGKVQIIQVPSPKPKEEEIVVQVKSALTCGTTLKAFLRGHPKIKMPGPFGHEMAGLITAIGKGISHLAVGDRVVALHTSPCGQCSFCHSQKQNLCEAFSKNINLGAYGEEFLIPSSIVKQYVFKLPDDVSFTRGACLQSLACVLHGFKKLQVLAHETINIIGTGSFSVLFFLLCKHKKLSVKILGKNEKHLERLTKYKIPCEISSKSTEPSDIVIEAVGGIGPWQDSFNLVKKGGRILFFGGLPKDTLFQIDGHRMHYDEISLLSSFHYRPQDVEEAKELLFSDLDPTFLIEQSLALEELEIAFQNMLNKKGFKYEICPS